MYQPKISDENIHKIYMQKLKINKPMTKILDEILNNYFKSLPENFETDEPKKTLKRMNYFRNKLCEFYAETIKEEIAVNSDNQEKALMKLNLPTHQIILLTCGRHIIL